MKNNLSKIICAISIVVLMFSPAFAESYNEPLNDSELVGNIEMTFEEMLEAISIVSNGRDTPYVEHNVYQEEGGPISDILNKYSEKKFVRLSSVVRNSSGNNEIIGAINVYGEGQVLGQDHVRIDRVLYARFEPNESLYSEYKREGVGLYGNLFLYFENGKDVFYSLNVDIVTSPKVLQLNLGSAYYLDADRGGTGRIVAIDNTGKGNLMSEKQIIAMGRVNGNF